MSELKPCPFCGEQELGIIPEIDNTKYFQIVCGHCGSLLNGYRRSDLLQTHWNLRPIEDALHAEVERLKARIEEMQAEVEESNSLLRSSLQIAKRNGIDTNWEAWRKQLDIALVRQHKLMYGEESEGECKTTN